MKCPQVSNLWSEIGIFCERQVSGFVKLLDFELIGFDYVGNCNQKWNFSSWFFALGFFWCKILLRIIV